MSKIEIAIIAAIIAIFGVIGYSALNDDRPLRCFEGFSYRVGSSGELHLRTSGKSQVPIKCEQ